MTGPASQAIGAQAAESNLYAMIEQMESYAEAGNWDEVEALAIRLRLAIMDVPAAHRRSVIVAAQRSVNKVVAGARSARQDVSGKLTELTRGKAAKKAYELR